MTISLIEPFDGLFTQGMVCHETYKNENEWLSPDEVMSEDGKNFFELKEVKKLLWVHQNLCQNQKEIL